MTRLSDCVSASAFASTAPICWYLCVLFVVAAELLVTPNPKPVYNTEIITIGRARCAPGLNPGYLAAARGDSDGRHLVLSFFINLMEVFRVRTG